MSFKTEFDARIDAIDTRAKAAGTSLTELCRRAGVARSTPDRWRKVTPKTVEIVTELESKLVEIETQRTKEAAAD